MPIRITGLNSGLDTESIISALVSSYSYKTSKYKKAQTKLSWKQDKWKALNTKIYSLYTNVGNLKYTSAYNTKTASVSDTTKASVTASAKAVNGTYTMEVKQVAKTGYLTGAQLGSNVTSSTTLAELGFSGDATISAGIGDAKRDIKVSGNTTIKEFTESLSAAGLSANYDATNHRMFVSAKETGAANDFTLTGADANGTKALDALGLNAASEANTKTYESFALYAKAKTDGGDIVDYYKKDAQGNLIKNGDGYELSDEVRAGAASYDADATKAAIQDIKNEMTDKSEQNVKLNSAIEYANAYKSYNDVKKKFKENNGTDAEWETFEKLVAMSNASSVYVKADGTTLDASKITEENGKYKYTYTDDNGHEQTEEFEKSELTHGAIKLAQLEVKAGLGTYSETNGYVISGPGVSAFKKNKETVENYEKTDNGTYINGDEATINAVHDAYAGTGDKTVADLTADWQSTVYTNTQYINEHTVLANDTESAEYLEKKVSAAMDALANPNYTKGAVRVDGQDAKIILNGAEFSSAGNTFEINGLTINAKAVTEGEMTVVVDNDVTGLYDKIKDFLTQYNSLVNELTSLYNADSAKGYEPLTDEEKDAMSDTEIEKWEEKIKASLLRRDDTLNGIINAMTTSMSKSYTVNGKRYSLASFGISTLGYLNAAKNEQNAYHIDGDEDDAATSGNDDKLMAALKADPDSVVEFMKQLTTGLYDSLDKKMKSSSLSSAYTVYNDKEMASEYSDYTDTITKWEDKLSEKEEYYYKKFSSMETALSKLQSQSSSLTGLFG